MADDTTGGGFVQGDGGSLFGNTSTTGSKNDYAGWNWHQIEAAIDGGSMMTTDDQRARAKGIADPATLWTAGNTFYTVQTTFQMVGEALKAQAKLLAGNDDSPWKGAAADAFMTMMTTFSGHVIDNANVLSGGTTGQYSVPDQLTTNGNTLSWAQSQIESIDQYYADAAVAEGADVVNGLVQIHEKPELVTMMTRDMLGVLNHVADNYTDTVRNVKNPTSTPSTSPPPLSPPPPISPPPNVNATPPPNFATAPPPDTGAGGGNGANIPNFSTAPPPGTSGTGGLGANGLPKDFAVSPPPGTGTAGGLGGLNGVGTPSNFAVSPPPGLDTAGGLSGLNGAGTPNNFAVSPTPGLSTAGGLSGLGGLPLSPLSLAAAPSKANSKLGGLNPAMDAALNPTTAGLPTASGLPSASGLPTESGLPTASGLGALNESGLPTSSELAASPALESSVPGQGGMPMMPNSGAGAPRNLTSEPSDASGLLSREAKPWTGTGAPTDEVGSLSGVGAGGLGLNGETLAAEPGLSAGMPGQGGMPMMPNSGAGSPATQSTERSDASGLLSGESAPWTGQSAPHLDEVSSVTGAASGGVGLNGEGVPGETLAAEPGVTAGAPGTGGMPMMPGMGSGAGAAGANANGERSDASGLIAGESEPWGEQAPAVEAEAQNGVAAGGAELFWAGETAPGQAAPEPAKGEERVEREEQPDEAAAEPELAEGAGESGLDGQDGAGAGEEQRVPLLGPSPEAQDPSGWEVAGTTADAALFTLGLWASRRRSRTGAEEETAARTVSSEEQVWGGDGASQVSEPDELPDVATWRPSRDGANGVAVAGSTALPKGRLRLGQLPEGYDPEAAAQAAAAKEAEAVAAAEQAVAEEEEQAASRGVADLLVQEADVWGGPRADWGAL